MVSGAEQLRGIYLLRNEQDGPAFKITNDPRVTWLGRWLRMTSIDEFPQLWNVLRGEMSLVGPRPLPCHEAEACEVWQRRRLDVTPGLTCLWQTRGRPRTSFALWMRLDLEYIRMQSFWTDVKLILLTIPTVLKNRADR
jgi:lipopolysaccharide/colanic/teichoic acid biosynthesis glycosyltransferase